MLLIDLLILLHFCFPKYFSLKFKRIVNKIKKSSRRMGNEIVKFLMILFSALKHTPISSVYTHTLMHYPPGSLSECHLMGCFNGEEDCGSGWQLLITHTRTRRHTHTV